MCKQTEIDGVIGKKKCLKLDDTGPSHESKYHTKYHTPLLSSYISYLGAERYIKWCDEQFPVWKWAVHLFQINAQSKGADLWRVLQEEVWWHVIAWEQNEDSPESLSRIASWRDKNTQNNSVSVFRTVNHMLCCHTCFDFNTKMWMQIACLQCMTFRPHTRHSAFWPSLDSLVRPQHKTGRSAQYLLSSSARIYGTRSWGRYSGSLATPQQVTIQQASEEKGGKGTQ